MNILVLPSWYPTKKNPLKGSFFKEQVEALRKNLNPVDNIVVLAYERFSILKLPLFLKSKKKEFFIENDVPTFFIRFIDNRFSLKHSGRIIDKAIKKIEKKFNKKFDIVHIHSALNAGIYFSFSKSKIPYIITEHATMFARNMLTAQQKKILPSVFNGAKEIIAVGNGLKNEIKKYTTKNVKIIFNMVSTKFCGRKNIKKNGFYFFSLGSNAKKKGADILISAFSILQKKMSNVFLTIGGLNESEKKWLEKIAQEKNLPKEKYELLLKIGREKVFDYMASCDAFVLLSRFETFGIVFVEAMFCGKPVIATLTGGPDSFVNEKNGILVPCEDAEKSALAMENLILNYAQYDGEKIKDFAKENFSPKIICQKIIEVYKTALEKNS